MATAVADFFSRNPQASGQLDMLMRNCQNGRCRRISVLVVGCGDAFITRYWPTLCEYVNQDLVVLTVVDQKPLAALTAEKIALALAAKDEGVAAKKLKEEYEKFCRMAEERLTPPLPRRVMFVDLSNPREQEWYYHLSADVVFIVVPDAAHVNEAYPWNGRATIVLIEKPYNRDLTQAREFVAKLEQLAGIGGEDAAHTLFFGLDHYFSKIFEYITMRRDVLEARVGQIQEIEVMICESGGVEPWRAETLDAGIAYDLMPHALAMIAPQVNLASFPLLQGGQPLRIRVARHEDCKIKDTKAETYISLCTTVRDHQERQVKLTTYLAKGAGLEDSKYAQFKGAHGTIRCELKRQGKILLETPDGNRSYFGSVNEGHPEILKAILSGQFMRQPVGCITSQEAVQILQTLDFIRGRVKEMKGNIKTYPLKTSVEKINELATEV